MKMIYYNKRRENYAKISISHMEVIYYMH